MFGKSNQSKPVNNDVLRRHSSNKDQQRSHSPFDEPNDLSIDMNTNCESRPSCFGQIPLAQPQFRPQQSMGIKASLVGLVFSSQSPNFVNDRVSQYQWQQYGPKFSETNEFWPTEGVNLYDDFMMDVDGMLDSEQNIEPEMNGFTEPPQQEYNFGEKDYQSDFNFNNNFGYNEIPFSWIDQSFDFLGNHGCVEKDPEDISDLILDCKVNSKDIQTSEKMQEDSEVDNQPSNDEQTLKANQNQQPQSEGEMSTQVELNLPEQSIFSDDCQSNEDHIAKTVTTVSQTDDLPKIVAVSGVDTTISNGSSAQPILKTPYEFQGDGRRREAKRLKNKATINFDEVELEAKIKNFQNENAQIQKLEKEVEGLKTLNVSKKELLSKRNQLNAQISRDRMKLELAYLKDQAVKYQQLQKKLQAKMNHNNINGLCNGGQRETVDELCKKCAQEVEKCLLKHTTEENPTVSQQNVLEMTGFTFVDENAPIRGPDRKRQKLK